MARTVPGVSDLQTPDRQWESFDLRRPTKLSREQLRAFDLFHDTFSRRLSNSVGRLARAAATVDIVRMSQLTWEEYQRTLPAVTTLVTAMAPPLPGELLVEMDTSLSLALAGRLLGGSGRMEPPRHPSELELPALQRVGALTVEALGEALGQFVDVSSHMQHLDLSPQLLAIAAPSQVVLVLTFSMTMPLLGTQGDLSLVMPLSSLSPMLEQLLSHSADRSGNQQPSHMQPVVETIPVVLHATLNPIRMAASSVAALTPGDVIVLDHRVGQPAVVSVGGQELMRGHLGRRGARLAIAVSEHPFDAPPPSPTSTNGMHAGSNLSFSGPVAPAGPDLTSGQHGYAQTAVDTEPVFERAAR